MAVERITILSCGCIVITIDHNITDWQPNCAAHKKVWDNAIQSHDDFIEEQVFNETSRPNWQNNK